MTGEAFGESAARDSLANDYGVPPTRVTTLHGPGVFDVIGEFPDGRIVVIEAKGPSADLGARKDLTGEMSQQGSRPYFETIVDRMRKGADADQRGIAAALADSLTLDDLERGTPGFEPSLVYDEVRPTVDSVPVLDENGSPQLDARGNPCLLYTSDAADE